MELQHFSHPHPLVLREDDTILNYPPDCKICYDGVSVPYYGCDSCGYYIHKSCAELPHQITHPFHPSHPLTLRSTDEPLRDYTCDSCHGVNYYTPCYRCDECDFYMDKGCALMEPITCNNQQDHIQHFTHQHPMPLLLQIVDEITCFACGSICTDDQPTCGCRKCNYFLHKSCAELQHEIHHPSHPSHSLILHAIHQTLSCSFCHNNIRRTISYKCRQCSYFLCVKCSTIIMSQKIKYTSHDHLLYFVEGMHTKIAQCQAYDGYCKKPLMSNSKEFDCTSSFLFRCVDCDFNVHLLCGPLPSIVKHEYHIDPLILVDSVVEDDSDEYYCDVCETERDPRICFYYCKECKYAAHVHCVISKVINILKGTQREDDVKLKIAAEDVWKFSREIQPNSTSTSEIDDDEEDQHMTFRDFINQLTLYEKRTLELYYKWEETSSDKNKGQVIEDSVLKLRDNEDINRIVKLSRFTHQNFQDILDEFNAFYNREEYLELLESTDLELKIVKVKGYMIPQTLAPVLKTVLHHHADVCTKSFYTTGVKSFVFFILCKVVKTMCSTMVKDITRDLLQQWYFHMRFLRNMGFEIDFAKTHFEKLVRAFLGLQAKRLEEEIPAKVNQKLAMLQQKIEDGKAELEKCKEYKGPSAKSEFMKECLNEASEWKWKKACDHLFDSHNLP